MLTVSDYGKIRRAREDGMSIREISRKFGWSRQAIRKALADPEPRKYQRKPKADRVLAAFEGLVDQILLEDESAPRKQRHTAKRIHERLVAEHAFPGSYDQVRRYVQTKRKRNRELFLPLDHAPGQRVECDFGHIHVDFPDGRRLVPVLLVTWAYSHHAYAIALPSERTESILWGMRLAFESFGCVPREAWWDNPTTVATEILKGRSRRLHDRYEALASHYRFEPHFCMPARGNEKPHVENRVKRLERTWATPVPAVRDLEELNARLREASQADLARTVQGRDGSIGERFREEQSRALPLPDRPFDPCIVVDREVNKYQMVEFDTNSYSVPRQCAFGPVSVRAYPHEVKVVHRDEVVATHPRSYGRKQPILDPRHYLATLERKPALLDHSRVYRDWTLPTAFNRLREDLEKRQAPRSASRQFIRVLQLLGTYPAAQVALVIDQALAREVDDVAWIIQKVERQTPREPAATDGSMSPSEEASTPAQDSSSSESQMNSKPRVPLSHFDNLLSNEPTVEPPVIPSDPEPSFANDFPNDQPPWKGPCNHAEREPEHRTVAAIPFETTSAADHAGRVCQAGP